MAQLKYYDSGLGQWVTAVVGAQGTQGIIGTQGLQGTTGLQGFIGLQGTNGSQGTQGIQGTQGLIGRLSGPVWSYNTSTADSEPGSGFFRTNNATESSATFLYIDNIDANSVDQGSWITSWDDSTSSTNYGYVTLTSITGTNIYRVSGSITVGVGYYKVPVVWITGTATIASGDSIAFSFSRTGDIGTQGTQGLQGTTGISNTVHMVTRTSSVSTPPNSLSTTNVFDTANDVVTLPANRRIQVRGQYFIDVTATGTSIGANINFSFSSVHAGEKIQFQTHNRTATTTLNRVGVNVESGGSGTAFQVVAGSASSQTVAVEFEGYINTTSSSSNMTPTFAATVAASSSFVTILAGSWLELTDVGSSTATEFSGDWA